MGIAGAEIATKEHNFYENLRKSDEHIKRNVGAYKDAGFEIDKKTLDKFISEGSKIGNQPTKGIMTKLIESDTSTKLFDSFTKIFRKD